MSSNKDVEVSDDTDQAWEVTSSFMEKRSSFTWKIEKFSRRPFHGFTSMESPSFSFLSSKWYLSLYPNGNTSKFEGVMRLFLNVINPVSETTVKYKMCLKDRTCDDQCVMEFEKVFGPEVKGWGGTLIDRKVLLEEKRKELLCGDVLTIHCEMRVGENVNGEVQCVDRPISFKREDIDIPKSIEIFLGDIGALLKEKKNCDVTVQAGDKQFATHKLLLGARSKVFAAMFEHDMEENRSNTVTITDIESEVMNDLLQFIYSGQVKDMSADKAIGLYPAAEKYALLDLKELCTDFLKRNLSESNICIVALMADTHNDGTIIDFIKDFIRANSSVLSSEEWMYFVEKHPRIAYEITIPLTKGML